MMVCKDQFPERGGYFMTNEEVSNLSIMHKLVTKKNHDFISVTDGFEGWGKSTKCQQTGYFFARNFRKKTKFTLDNIVFTPKKFTDAVLNAKKFSVVIWDEARSGTNVRRSMSSINNAITDMLAEIRQRNLFILFVMPTFMDMDANIAVWRAKALFHVYPYKLNRGYYKFFSAEKKRFLYFLGKQRKYDYGCVRPNFHGRFSGFWTIDYEEYATKKALALRAYDTPENNDVKKDFDKIPDVVQRYLSTTQACRVCKTRRVVYDTQEKQHLCRACGHVAEIEDTPVFTLPKTKPKNYDQNVPL